MDLGTKEYLKQEYFKARKFAVSAADQDQVSKLQKSFLKDIKSMEDDYAKEERSLWLAHQEVQTGKNSVDFRLPVTTKRIVNGVVVSPVTERLMKYCEDNNINASLCGGSDKIYNVSHTSSIVVLFRKDDK